MSYQHIGRLGVGHEITPGLAALVATVTPVFHRASLAAGLWGFGFGITQGVIAGKVSGIKKAVWPLSSRRRMAIRRERK